MYMTLSSIVYVPRHIPYWMSGFVFSLVGLALLQVMSPNTKPGVWSPPPVYKVMPDEIGGGHT